MAAPTPTNEPFKITAGDTLRFDKSLADYSAADGWTLTYHFRGPASVNITATADGSGWTVAENAAFATAGTYFWAAYVAKDGERYKIDEGTLEVAADLSAAGANYDGRSATKIRLDAIDSAITSLVGKTKSSVSVDGTSYTNANLRELYEVRNMVRGEYLREVAAEQRANGRGSGNMIYTSFGPTRWAPGRPYWER